MDFERVNNRKGHLAVLLLVVSAAAAVAALARVASLFTASAAAQTSLAAAVKYGVEPNDMPNYLAESSRMAEELKKKNLFVPPTPKQHPVKAVSGILGDEALINGKWYKAGDKIGDANIVAIEPTQVKIKWAGSDKWFAPIAAATPKQPQTPANEAVAKKETTQAATKSAAQPEKAGEVKTTETPKTDDPLAWLGVTLSDSLKAKLLEKWNELDDSQKEQMKEQWNKMSGEQKQQVVSMWEQHL